MAVAAEVQAGVIAERLFTRQGAHAASDLRYLVTFYFIF